MPYRMRHRPSPTPHRSWLSTGQNKLRPYMSTSWPHYLDIRSQQTVFSQLAAYVRVEATLRQGASWGEMTSANYFTTLGLQPALGRFFCPLKKAPAHPSRSSVMTFGSALWGKPWSRSEPLSGSISTQ